MSEHKQEVPWSLYWAADRLHSCVANDEQHDQAVINAVWRGIVKDLNPGASVLDLATGNGAVLRAILDERSDLNLYGVDRASIDPMKHLSDHSKMSAIKFYSDTDINALPAFDIKFDLVTSQFGVEYAGLPNAFDSILRTLDDGGRLELLIHHESSDIIGSSRPKIVELSALLEKNGLIELLQQFVHAKIEFSPLEAAGQAVLNEAGKFSEAITGQVFEGIEAIISVPRPEWFRAVEMANTLTMKLNAELQRLLQMRDAAQSEQNMIEHCKQLESKGMQKVEFEPFYASGNYLLAWRLSAEQLSA